MATKKLILIRHGQTDYNRQRRFAGSTDVPLNAMGLRQADALAEALKDFSPDAIFTSPKIRVKQTAHPTPGQKFVDDDLREMNFGRWEGITFDEINATEPQELLQKWFDFDLDFSFPEGESIEDFATRANSAADRICSTDAETIFVFAHGLVIRAILCNLLNLPIGKVFAFGVDNASLSTVLVSDEGNVLLSLNVTSHLKGISDDG